MNKLKNLKNSIKNTRSDFYYKVVKLLKLMQKTKNHIYYNLKYNIL